jgi:histone deacetylase 11
VALIVRQNPLLRVLIVDLDAHQGNGYAQILLNDPQVAIYDVFNAKKYPYMVEEDRSLRRRIDFPYPIDGGQEASTDAEYMNLLRGSLHQAFMVSKPDLCIYIAGSDIYQGDPFGGLGVSAKGVLERDEFVFMVASGLLVPIVMLLGGGYSDDNAIVVSQSIKNLLTHTHTKGKCCVL